MNKLWQRLHSSNFGRYCSEECPCLLWLKAILENGSKGKKNNYIWTHPTAKICSIICILNTVLTVWFISLNTLKWNIDLQWLILDSFSTITLALGGVSKTQALIHLLQTFPVHKRYLENQYLFIKRQILCQKLWHSKDISLA